MPKPVLERVLGYVLIAAALLGVLLAIGCVGDVEVRSDGNMNCLAPAYDIQAVSCGFDLVCNTKAGIDIADSDWECWCNVVPKRSKDLHLECTLTSTGG